MKLFSRKKFAIIEKSINPNENLEFLSTATETGHIVPVAAGESGALVLPFTFLKTFCRIKRQKIFFFFIFI